MSQNFITSHILDTAKGLPARAVPMFLYKKTDTDWQLLSQATTDDDGRVNDWPGIDLLPKRGSYKIAFQLSHYFGENCFYPIAEITFQVNDERHHHIPLLISPFGYSTYRGS